MQPPDDSVTQAPAAPPAGSAYSPSGHVHGSGTPPAPLFGAPGAWSASPIAAGRSPYAGFWVRLLAFAVDAIPPGLSLGALGAAGVPVGVEAGQSRATLGNGASVHEISLAVTSLVPLLVVLAYFAVLWSTLSATLGMRLLGLRIVRAADGAGLSVGGAVVRALGLGLALLPFAVGLLWVAFDRRKQGWHDKLAGTVVLRAR